MRPLIKEFTRLEWSPPGLSLVNRGHNHDTWRWCPDPKTAIMLDTMTDSYELFLCNMTGYEGLNMLMQKGIVKMLVWDPEGYKYNLKLANGTMAFGQTLFDAVTVILMGLESLDQFAEDAGDIPEPEDEPVLGDELDPKPGEEPPEPGESDVAGPVNTAIKT
tara:strand:+ start:1016 stop:1501 length:486 start_codon:yes stop_codon:yes gene_type:complete